MSNRNDRYGPRRLAIEGAYGVVIMASWVVGSIVWVVGTIVLIGPHGLAA